MSKHHYPATVPERADFLNPKTGSKVTEFQFRVFDLCGQIPKGSISTYKILSDVLKSSPRAVGQALKKNPFCPDPIPCHRVLASTFFIGGFSGEWGAGDKIDSKRALLESEGVMFDETDHLDPSVREKCVFKDFKT